METLRGDKEPLSPDFVHGFSQEATAAYGCQELALEEVKDMYKLTRARLLQVVKLAHDKGEGPDLRRANLDGANLSGVDLRGANLRGALLGGADLSEADLSGANLGGAFLGRANLGRANLSRADLHWANLTRANLCGAVLERANLAATNLSEAEYDRSTVWPKGLDPTQAGAKSVE